MGPPREAAFPALLLYVRVPVKPESLLSSTPETSSAGSQSRPGRYSSHRPQAAVFMVRDGKLTSVKEYADTDHVADVLFPAA
ncbi:ketosteroid isomerase-like protein [Catenulispora sp. GAS73]|uniref:hypothetical protein n=1 Tax=Catenulispora sp. GAS73 TaxID=3156269 RepID=UPI0035175E98